MRITSEDLRVLSMPSRYIQGSGALNKIGDELARVSRRPLIIVDEFVLSSFGDAIRESLAKAEIEAEIAPFSGFCTQTKARQFAALCADKSCDLVCGVGGGSAIDVAKGTVILSTNTNLRVATVPTVASNDAPTSRGSVFYTEEGSLEKVALLSSNPDLVLVDTAVIAKAPVHFLISGIGDALTTKFEAEQCAAAGHQSRVDARQTMTGMAIGNLCYETIKQYGQQALLSVEQGVVTEALEKVVEATILLSGAGFENGGLACAHAMTRGLSKVPQLHGCLHGYEVAYGLMVQFVLEGRDHQFMTEMTNFYTKLGLPRCLGDLGLPEVNDEILDLIVEPTCQSEDSHIYKMTVPVDRMRLKAAILVVESLVQK